MKNKLLRLVIVIGFSIFMLNSWGYAWIQGIYLTQSTMQNDSYIDYLIRRSQEAGVNTFVVDFERFNAKYAKNVKKLSEHQIDFVARIVIFQDGASAEQIENKNYWQGKWQLMKKAIDLGVKKIQIDYIRYQDQGEALLSKTKKITEIVKWYSEQLASYNIPLQVDVFGVVAHGPHHGIGQDLKSLAPYIQYACPMVYPSHYYWDKKYLRNPYGTILNSLTALKKQFQGDLPFQVVPYIQAFDLRRAYSGLEFDQYLQAQLEAVKATQGMSGWYAWNAYNRYESLFDVLKNPPEVEVSPLESH